MKTDLVEVIRQEIERLKSHINLLNEEIDSKWTSEHSRYILRKDLAQTKGELEDIQEAIQRLAEENKR